MIIGKSYEALNTNMVRKNELIPGKIGHVIYIDSAAISLQFFEKDVKVPRSLFGVNFKPCNISMTPNLGYQASKHADHVFS